MEVGQTLVTVDAVGRKRSISAKEKVADVRTGLNWIAGRSPGDVCVRPSLQPYDFADRQPFVEDAMRLVRQFDKIPIDRMSVALINKLRDLVYMIAVLINKMESFEYSKRLGIRLFEFEELTTTISNLENKLIARLANILEEMSCAETGPSADEELKDKAAAQRLFVFISHSHCDEDMVWAKEFANQLTEEDIPYFMDEKTISYGEPIVDIIKDRLEQTSHLVVMISPAVWDSPWIWYEVGIAQRRGCEIVPYVHHSADRIPDFIMYHRRVSKADVPRFLEELKRFKST